MKIIIDNIIVSPEQKPGDLEKEITKKLGFTPAQFKILRKSLDARKKSSIVYRYRVMAEVPDEKAEIFLKDPVISPFNEAASIVPSVAVPISDIYIVGSGPAGLFCALRLIESGCRVRILERGKGIEERMNDIKRLEADGVLNCESNVLFGEGGAGTYSDGKLTTRTSRPEINWFYEKLGQFGAPEEIFYDTRPHLGTDRLRDIIKNIRKYIIEKGSDISFGSKVNELLVKDGAIAGLRTSKGEEFLSPNVVLAIGHSARDTYEMLELKGVNLVKKGFAIGVRVEHCSSLIYDIQYGKKNRGLKLPAAEYRLTWNNRDTGRGVYSFCMCPGGDVINASSDQGMLNTNGMSFSARNGNFSNAAILVTVHPDDLGDSSLSGIAFQREIERACFREGGGSFIAPAQRISSFIKDRLDKSIPDSTYKPGIVPGRIGSYLPAWITDELRAGLNHFNDVMKGFVEGLLVGVETRSSSPVRILRDESMQSVTVKGLFPAGEGAGYAGGIVSSAVDGIRVADAIINKAVNS